MRYKNLAHVAMLVFGLIALPLALQNCGSDHWPSIRLKAWRS